MDKPEDPYKYRCPICGRTYDIETLTRLHVTRADDDQHDGRCGLLPDVVIEVLDVDGVVIDRRSKRPGEVEFGGIRPADIPDEFSGSEKYAIVAAAHQPHEVKYSEIKQLADERLEQTDLSPLLLDTVRRVCREFFQPKSPGDAADGDNQS